MRHLIKVITGDLTVIKDMIDTAECDHIAYVIPVANA